MRLDIKHNLARLMDQLSSLFPSNRLHPRVAKLRALEFEVENMIKRGSRASNYTPNLETDKTTLNSLICSYFDQGLILSEIHANVRSAAKKVHTETIYGSSRAEHISMFYETFFEGAAQAEKTDEVASRIKMNRIQLVYSLVGSG